MIMSVLLRPQAGQISPFQMTLVRVIQFSAVSRPGDLQDVHLLIITDEAEL